MKRMTLAIAVAAILAVLASANGYAQSGQTAPKTRGGTTKTSGMLMDLMIPKEAVVPKDKARRPRPIPNEPKR